MSAKRKRVHIDDPNQFHAKPKDLSLNALDAPRNNNSTGKDRLFTASRFDSFGLQSRLADELQKPLVDGGMGLKTATAVQSVVIPELVTNRKNMLIKSHTGSGKTLSYLVPIINDLISIGNSSNRSDGTRAIVVAPTRELCAQICDVLNRLTKCCVWIVGGSISGGEKKKSEKARLRKGVTVLVATPGRLLDHLRTTESFTLTNLRWIVLDEADRLLDMGFEQSVLEILSLIHGKPLPGLKSNDKNSSGGGGGGNAKNLQQKWSQQNSLQAKKSSDSSAITHILASATLTNTVKQFSISVLGASNKDGFQIVDAETRKSQLIKSAEDLMQLSTASYQLLDGGALNSDPNRAVSMDDDESEEGGAEGGGGKEMRNAIGKGELMEVPVQLSQYYMMVSCKWRLSGLLSFLRVHKDKKVIVFMATCDSVDYHALLLREAQWPEDLDEAIFNHQDENSSGGKGKKGEESGEITSPVPSKLISQHLDPLSTCFTGVLGSDCSIYRLHGNLPQQERQSIYHSFCAAKKGIMLCTDVAARGLDLPHVDWILQYDPPCETTDYVHRIGRTARKGLSGSAVIFLLPSEAGYIQMLTSHGLSLEALSLQSLFLEASKFIPGAKKFKNLDEMAAVILQRRMERTIYHNRWLLLAACQTFRSFVRAYATHSADTKSIFRIQSLHLGHVAKSFALHENPTNLKNNSQHKENVIVKINSGSYALRSALSGAAKKNAQQPVLDNSEGKGSSSGEPKSKKQRRETAAESSKVVVSAEELEQAEQEHERARLLKAAERLQKYTPVSETKKSSSKRATQRGKLRSTSLAASGKFRKTTGYFRKKLRAHATSEFST